MGTFNTYGKTSKEYAGGKVIWRQVKGVYPSGGKLVYSGTHSGTTYNIGDVVPAGSMVQFDMVKKTVTVVKNADVSTAGATTINGLLYNDVYLEEGTDFATGAVVYAGEIYEDRLAEAIPDDVKANLPQIVFIKEKSE